MAYPLHHLASWRLSRLFGMATRHGTMRSFWSLVFLSWLLHRLLHLHVRTLSFSASSETPWLYATRVESCSTFTALTFIHSFPHTSLSDLNRSNCQCRCNRWPLASLCSWLHRTFVNFQVRLTVDFPCTLFK